MKILADYFLSGAAICPYARSASISFFSEDKVRKYPTRWVGDALYLSASVIYASAGERSFEEAQKWCLDTVEALREPLCMDMSQLPRVDAGGSLLFVIGMGPQYPVRHPRYAPQLCLVAVNEAEIQRAPDQVRRVVAAAMIERTGVMYDANQFWLELEPRAK